MLKCVVWDLDNTLWKGTLAEDDHVEIDRELLRFIVESDRKGVLHSIASRNDFEVAMSRLRELKVEHYFVFPQIGWVPKSESIKSLSVFLNLGLGSFVFIDDQPFERDEVNTHLKNVRCFSPNEVIVLEASPEFQSIRVTEESQRRRSLYRDEEKRVLSAKEYQPNSLEFNQSMELKLSVRKAMDNDLLRLEELTERTHQLNTTGKIYSESDLRILLSDPNFHILVANLKDRFGAYGLVGLVVLEKTSLYMTMQLFILSCRVLNRGIAIPLMQKIAEYAHRQNLSLKGYYVPSRKNRIMEMTYRLAGFQLEEDAFVYKKNDFQTCSYVDIDLRVDGYS